jgi:hypothetical protein
VRFILIFLLLGFFTEAHAYLDYSPNANLEQEIEANPYRILPHSEHLFLTLDADFFKPVFSGGDNNSFYKYDFYHGNGYWMDIRSEYKYNDDLVVNFKASVTHGTSSNGPTYLAEIIPFVAITYRQHGFLGFNWEARLSDIDRQTVGIGLFIEDKETDGGYLIAKKDIFTGKIMVDGTGSYQLDGGVVVGDFNLWDGLLGATGMINETATSFHPPQFMGTVYSRKDWKNGLGYGVEAGGDDATYSAMAYLKYEDTFFNHLHIFVKPQFRSYGKGILGSLPGNIQQNYVSYDQNDKPFTTLMDIFVYGDDVQTYSSQINAEYIFNHFYRLYAETELVDFQYHERDPIEEMFFRTGVKFFPFANRPDEFGFLVGNKYLIASTTQSQFSSGTRTYSDPQTPDFENKPLFLKQFYFMFNFTTKM